MLNHYYRQWTGDCVNLQKKFHNDDDEEDNQRSSGRDSSCRNTTSKIHRDQYYSPAKLIQHKERHVRRLPFWTLLFHYYLITVVMDEVYGFHHPVHCPSIQRSLLLLSPLSQQQQQQQQQRRMHSIPQNKKLKTKSTTAQLSRLSEDTTTSTRTTTTTTTTTTTDLQQKRINDAITKLITKHDPILLFASKLLPSPEIRNDALALYAWCRRLDEICDSTDNVDNKEEIQRQLDVWQRRFDDIIFVVQKEEQNNNDNDTSGDVDVDVDDNDNEDEYLMDLALKNCIERYNNRPHNDKNNNNYLIMSRQPFDDMIEGMKADAVDNRRIQNMTELETYAYQVAGTVGLMLLPLLFSSSSSSGTNQTRMEMTAKIERGKKPAICLGKAIQLVNILRDAKQDVILGRIYLPQDLLEQNNVNEKEDILEENTTTTTTTTTNKAIIASDGYREVVKIVSVRAYELLEEAEIGAKDSLSSVPYGQIFVQIIIELYRDYLYELKYNRHYDNLHYYDDDRGGTHNNDNTNNNNKKNDNNARVRISTIRKVQASFRAVLKIIFN